MNGHNDGVDEVQRTVRQHVLLETVRQADGLPHPHDFLVGGDRPRTSVHIRITLDYKYFQAELAQQVRGGSAGRPVADHGHVIGRCLGYFCLSSSAPPVGLLL